MAGRGALERHPRRRLVILSLVALLLASALSGVSLWWMADHSGGGSTGLVPAQNIVINSGYGGKACTGVSTCSTTIAVAANSALLVGVSEYGTTTTGRLVAVHGYTPSSIEAPSTGSSYPTELIEGVLATSAATVTVYVNFSAAQYYVIDVADFENTVVTSTYWSGVGSATAHSTSQSCSATTTVAGEAIFAVFGVKTSSESTMTPGAGSQITGPTATTSSVVTAEDQYYVDASTGAYSSTNALASSGYGRSACVGLIPANVPTAPTGLASGSATTTTIPLTWTNTASQAPWLTAGEVYWASYGGSCGTFSSSAAASSPYDAYTVTGLTSGSAYCFYVTVSNGTGVSADSAILSDVPTLSLPSGPTGLVAFADAGTTTEVTVQWTIGTQTTVNQTIMQTSTTSGSCNAFTSANGAVWTNVPDPNTTEFVATGLVTATTYCWEVQGWNSVGEGAWSASVQGTTYSVTGAPTSLGETGVTLYAVSLTWTNPTPSSGSSIINDTVVLSTTTCGVGTAWYSVGAVGAYTVSSLTPDTKYNFSVIPWTQGGKGTESACIAATTLATLPGAPTGLTATGETTTTISVRWTNPTVTGGSLQNLTVLYGTTCGTWTQLSTAGVVTSFTITGLTQSTNYCVSVEAWTQGGVGPNSTHITVATTGTAPAAPTSLALQSASRTALTVSWANPSGTLANDTIYYKAAASCGSGMTGVSLGIVTSYQIPNLVVGTQYSIEVTAWSSGGQSADSSCLTVSTQGATPPAPTQLTVTATGATWVTLSWVNPAGYTLYNDTVLVSSPGGSCGTWATRVSTQGVLQSYNVTGLTSGQTYCIAVTAWDGESPPSSPVSIVTLSAQSSSTGQSGPGGSFPPLPFDPQSMTPYSAVLLYLGMGLVIAGAFTLYFRMWPGVVMVVIGAVLVVAAFAWPGIG